MRGASLSQRERDDDATRLITAFPSFRELVDKAAKGYTPTIRVEAYLSRRHRNRAEYLRRRLAELHLRVSPAWGTYQGEDDAVAVAVEAQP